MLGSGSTGSFRFLPAGALGMVRLCVVVSDVVVRVRRELAVVVCEKFIFKSQIWHTSMLWTHLTFAETDATEWVWVL